MADLSALTMPKLGLAMTEGMVAQWLKQEGETISAGEEVADIETSKITSGFESPLSGTLRRHVAQPGEMLPVGALIGVIDAGDADGGAVDAFVAEWQARFAEQAKDAGEVAPTPQRVETAEGPIQFMEAGPEDTPAIVLVHGFGGDLNNWMFVQPILAEQCRTLALDLPGHGGSGKALNGADAPALARAVAALMDARGIASAHLVGHSLGGAVALALAQQDPGRVRGLTLISPAGLGPDINMEYIGGFIAAKRGKQMTQVVQMLFADPSLIGREMVETLLRYKRLDGVEAALQSIASASFADGRQAVSYRDTLDGLSVPVTVVWGEQDRIIPAAHADGLPASVRMQRYADAGHMAHMEKAAELAELIKAQMA
jgi:pyruvate dehydrogenase E2 component (dihydrolipoamide acetyltransferase)